MGIQKASCASGSLRCPPWSSWTVPPRPTFVRTSPALCPSKNPRSYAGCSWTGPRRWRATDIWRTSCVLQICCCLTLLSVNTKAVESSALLLIWASAVPCRSKKKMPLCRFSSSIHFYLASFIFNQPIKASPQYDAAIAMYHNNSNEFSEMHWGLLNASPKVTF